MERRSNLAIQLCEPHGGHRLIQTIKDMKKLQSVWVAGNRTPRRLPRLPISLDSLITIHIIY